MPFVLEKEAAMELEVNFVGSFMVERHPTNCPIKLDFDRKKIFLSA